MHGFKMQYEVAFRLSCCLLVNMHDRLKADVKSTSNLTQNSRSHGFLLKWLEFTRENVLNASKCAE